jgi:hypothetical protein
MLIDQAHSPNYLIHGLSNVYSNDVFQWLYFKWLQLTIFLMVIIYGDYFSIITNSRYVYFQWSLSYYWFQWNFYSDNDASWDGPKLILWFIEVCVWMWCIFVFPLFLKEHDKVSRGLWVLNNSSLLSCIKECDSTKKKGELTNHEIFITFSTLATLYNIHFVTYSFSKKTIDPIYSNYNMKGCLPRFPKNIPWINFIYFLLWKINCVKFLRS